MTTFEPLLLLPGLLCDERLWRDQIQGLAGVEAGVADLTQDSDLAGMARRALAAAPPRFALAGVSMGGYVALEIIRRAPERVTRLALFDTSARPDTDEASRRRRGLMALTRSGQFRGVTPRLLPQLIHPDRLEGPLGPEVMAMAERIGRDAFLRQQEAILARPDSRPMLGSIAVPTLVAVGAQDALTPPHLAAEMAAGIPGARASAWADPATLTAFPPELAEAWAGLAWPSARAHSHLLAALPPGAFPGVDETEVYSFLASRD